jgi:hypothetical protein
MDIGNNLRDCFCTVKKTKEAPMPCAGAGAVSRLGDLSSFGLEFWGYCFSFGYFRGVFLFLSAAFRSPPATP